MSLITKHKELIKYFIVGMLGTAVDFGFFYFALSLNTPILIAQWIGSMSGFTHNHIWQHYKVFTHTQKFHKTYVVSMMISVISILISGPILLFLNTFVPYLWLSKIIILGFTFVILYIIRKKWVFVTEAEEIKN